MAILVTLFGSWLIFRGIGALGAAALASWQDSCRYALALMFVFTGIAHFNSMKYDLARMVPRFFPQPMAMVYFTGVLELLGALGLVLPGFQAAAGVGLVLLLIAMFPANVKAAKENLKLRGKPATALALRLPMQILFGVLLLWSSVLR